MAGKFHGYSAHFLRNRGLLPGLLTRRRVVDVLRKAFERPNWGTVRMAASFVPLEHTALRFPPCVICELTNHCNLQCTMCLRELSNQGVHGYMSDEVFERVIDEVSQLKGVRLGISSDRGECMMHPNYVEWLQRAKEANKFGDTYTLTNATLLTEEISRAMVDMQLDDIEISTDGATKETYEHFRIGADYDIVMANIQRLVRIRKEARSLKPRIMIRFIKMRENQHEIEDFRAMWDKILAPHDYLGLQSLMSPTVRSPGLKMRDDWLGKTKGHQSPPCKDLWRVMHVRWDGGIEFCDTMEDASLGIKKHILNETMGETWRSKELRRVRRKHLRGKRHELASCANCHCSFSFLGDEKEPIEEEEAFAV